MISIYKKVTDQKQVEDGVLFEQAFINDGEQIPNGWTTDKDSLEIPEPQQSEADLIKQQQASMILAQAEHAAMLQQSNMTVAKLMMQVAELTQTEGGNE